MNPEAAALAAQGQAIEDADFEMVQQIQVCPKT